MIDGKPITFDYKKQSPFLPFSGNTNGIPPETQLKTKREQNTKKKLMLEQGEIVSEILLKLNSIKQLSEPSYKDDIESIDWLDNGNTWLPSNLLISLFDMNTLKKEIHVKIKQYKGNDKSGAAWKEPTDNRNDMINKMKNNENKTRLDSFIAKLKTDIDKLANTPVGGALSGGGLSAESQVSRIIEQVGKIKELLKKIDDEAAKQKYKNIIKNIFAPYKNKNNNNINEIIKRTNIDLSSILVNDAGTPT